jgi:dipeptidyl aminopeptidase/acylaminoacyl peptidase
MLLLVVTGISIAVGWTLVHPKPKKLGDSPASSGMVYKDITFGSHDGLLLKGWFITAEANGHQANGKTIVFVHGYKGNRLQEGFGLLELTHTLQKLGYNALLFDLRASGDSEGKKVSIGYHEKMDVLAAVSAVKKMVPNNKIILMGFSMGASTALLAAGEDQTINAVVADSPFCNLAPFLSENLSHWSKLPTLPFTPLIMGILPYLTRIDVKRINPSEAVKTLTEKQSVLLIHGKKDASISFHHSVRLYENLKHNKRRLWLVPEGEHVGNRSADPEEYDKRLIQFLHTI